MLIPIIQIDSGKAQKLDVVSGFQKLTTNQLAIREMQKNYTKPLLRLGMILVYTKLEIGLKDRLSTRYINLVLNIFPGLVLVLLLHPMKSTKQMFFTCLMIGWDKLLIFFVLML